MSTENLKSWGNIIARAERAHERFSPYWTNLSKDEKALAAYVTEVTEWLGGREATAKILGVSPSSIDNYRQGKTAPKSLELVRLIAGYRVVQRQGLEKIDNPDVPTAEDLDDMAKLYGAETAVDLFLAQSGFSESPSTYEASPAASDLVFVPALDVLASAGAGAFNGEEPVTGELAFRRDLLRGLGVSSPGALRVLEARGESMEPLIRAGDLLLVDTGIDRVVDQAVYVFVWGGALIVKSVRIDRNGDIRLISVNGGDTTLVPASETPELRAAGRVVRVIRAL